MTPATKGAILVVDDEEPIGKMMTSWLVADGYDVEYADNFDAAKDALAARSFDVVTLDIVMPGASGLQVLSWIRQHHPDTAVVMATAMGDLDTVLEAMRSGAVNYLLKPFNLELMSAEIERVMERQRLIAENRSYQRDLESRVEAQTGEIRAAHAELAIRVRELEGRDRLIQCQMNGPSEEEARNVLLQVCGEIMQLRRAAILQSSADGKLTVIGATSFLQPGTRGTPTLSDSNIPDLAVRAASGGVSVWEMPFGAIPLMYQQRSLGVLWVECNTDHSFSECQRVARHLAQQGAVTLWSAGISAALDRDDLGLQELMEIE